MEENEKLLCPSCGAELIPGKEFCTNCGFHLIKEEKTEPEQQETIPEEIKEEAAPAAEESAEEVPAILPEEPEKKESRKERKQREKEEAKTAKEQEKLRVKEEKKLQKEEKKKARKAYFRQRNIWAIILMVLFLAGLCYTGFLYFGEIQNRRALENESASLNEKITELEEELEEQKQAVSDKAAEVDAGFAVIEELNTQIEELEGEIAEQEKAGSALSEEYDALTEDYDALTEIFSLENLGYASRYISCGRGAIVLEKSEEFELEINADSVDKVVVESGDSAEYELYDDDGEYSILFTAKKPGITVFAITGGKKAETIRIAVIVNS